jgi:ligand-binding sensor domain-containing protein
MRTSRGKAKVLEVIVLLAACSSLRASDGDTREIPAERTLETSGGTCATNSRLKFTTGVRAIFEDSKGRFWFGSQQEGVALYDGSEFTYYTVSDGLSDNQVRTIQQDQAGVMWFGTGNGITSFDGDTFKIHPGRSQGRLDLAPVDTWRSEVGDLWFHGDSGMRRGFDGQGVYRYDGRSLSYLPLPLPERVDKENPYLVTGIVKGRAGTVWIATYQGVFRYDGHSFMVISDETVGIESGGERLHVRCIFEDSRGNLWIGNNGLGVLLYDGQTVSNFTRKHGLSIREKGPTGSLGRIFSIAEDAAGNIWFGTRDNGAWRFNGKSLTNFTLADGLTSSMVSTIYRDKRDVLWFGLSDGSVCRFNGETFDRIY